MDINIIRSNAEERKDKKERMGWEDEFALSKWGSYAPLNCLQD